MIYTCIALALGVGRADASCSLPDLSAIANGLINDATPVHNALASLGTCATTIDNTQIGVLGIFDSQIIPTNGAQGTFGGGVTHTFGNNGVITGSTTPLAVVGLAQVTGVAGQSADIFDVNGNSGAGTIALFGVEGNGLVDHYLTDWKPTNAYSGSSTTTTAIGAQTPITVANVTGLVVGEQIVVDTGGNIEYINVGSLTATTITPATNWQIVHGPGAYTIIANGLLPDKVQIVNDNQAHQGLRISLPTNGGLPTIGLAVQLAFDTKAPQTIELFNPDGSVDSCPTIAAANLCAPMSPVFTVAGSSAGPSFHWDKPVAFVSDLNGACGAGAQCTLDNATLSLAGAGSFLDATFQCVVTDSGAAASFNFGAVPASASSVTIHVRNVTSGSLGDEAAVIATVLCGGS